MKIKITFSNYLDFQFFKAFFYWVMVGFTMLIGFGNPPNINFKELMMSAPIAIIWLTYLEWLESKLEVID